MQTLIYELGNRRIIKSFMKNFLRNTLSSYTFVLLGEKKRENYEEDIQLNDIFFPTTTTNEILLRKLFHLKCVF